MKIISITLVSTCLLLSSALSSASICFIPRDASSTEPEWKFEFGVAFISHNSIEDFLTGDLNIESGAAGGEIYTLTASKQLGELKIDIGDCTLRPQLELPLTLEIVDENTGDTFLDYNASLMLRWVDFPWNHHVKTSFAIGLGLSYSSQVYLMDRKRHPGDDRSHLKFNLPIQLTLAHPNYEDHELLLFILHQSGGHIFDEGGVNSVGLGYRFSF